MAVKKRSATASLGFAILRPHPCRSAQVGVEELFQPGEGLVDDGRLRVDLVVDDLAAEPSESREGALESFRDRVVRELRDSPEPLRATPLGVKIGGLDGAQIGRESKMGKLRAISLVAKPVF